MSQSSSAAVKDPSTLSPFAETRNRITTQPASRIQPQLSPRVLQIFELDYNDNKDGNKPVSGRYSVEELTAAITLRKGTGTPSARSPVYLEPYFNVAENINLIRGGCIPVRARSNERFHPSLEMIPEAEEESRV